MKKVLASVLAVGMLSSCLFGATAQAEEKEWFGTEDGKTITLRFWGGVQPEYGYDDVVANFNEEYKDKGVQVEYVRYVNDTSGNIQLDTYLMSGGEIDVFMAYGGITKLKERVESNLLWDMSEKIEEYGFDLSEELGAASMTNFTFDDGSVYGFPTKYSNQRWMLANVDMFEAAGVEVPYDGWTYSEFLAAAEKLTNGEGQEKVHGVSFALKELPVCIKDILGSVLQQYCTYKTDDCTEVNFDNDIYKEGFEMIMTALDNGWAIPIEDEVSEDVGVANTFLTGKCAMIPNVSQMRLCMDAETYPHDFTTAIIPGPVPEGYEEEEYLTHACVIGAGDLICIPEKTEYKDAAFEFAMWYTRGGMLPLAKGGRIPLWTGLNQEEVKRSE